MTNKDVPAPSISRAAFACPHCGAHATQHWFALAAIWSQRPPRVITQADLALAEKRTPTELNKKELEQQIADFRRAIEGAPFITRTHETARDVPHLENVFASRCYTCLQVALWIRDRMIFPINLSGPSPNQDLSADVMRDFEEARSVLDISPRGAAALLRLAVEKICTELGAKGKDINEQIADLVVKGLPVEVQRALDAVRVIGNQAVHPGFMDLKDDKDTALKLFGLVNFIAEDRISRPKQIAAMYDMIPASTRARIEQRDTKGKA